MMSLCELVSTHVGCFTIPWTVRWYQWTVGSVSAILVTSWRSGQWMTWLLCSGITAWVIGVETGWWQPVTTFSRGSTFRRIPILLHEDLFLQRHREERKSSGSWEFSHDASTETTLVITHWIYCNKAEKSRSNKPQQPSLDNVSHRKQDVTFKRRGQITRKLTDLLPAMMKGHGFCPQSKVFLSFDFFIFYSFQYLQTDKWWIVGCMLQGYIECCIHFLFYSSVVILAIFKLNRDPVLVNSVFTLTFNTGFAVLLCAHWYLFLFTFWRVVLSCDQHNENLKHY